jgi:rhodanese-related sulfurtransferase
MQVGEFMKQFKIFLLVIVFVLLVLTGWVFQVGIAAERTIMNDSFYRDMIGRTELSPYLHAALLEQLYSEVSAVLPDNLASIVTRVLGTVFDEQWVEEQTLVIVDDLLNYLKGRQGDLNAVIDLREKKEQLKWGITGALDLIPSQVIRMMGFDPRELEELSAGLVNELPLPDQLPVKQIIAGQTEGGNIYNSLDQFKRIRFLYLYLPYPVFLFMLFLAYKLAGLAGACKWFGGAAFTSGVILSLVLQLGRSYFLLPLLSAVLPDWLPEPELLLPAARFTVDSAAAIAIYYTLGGLLIMLTGGLLAWIGAFKRKVPTR